MKNVNNYKLFLEQVNPDDPYSEENWGDPAPVNDNDVQFVSADWKDTDELINGFKDSITHFGLFVYDDPAMEGSDQFGFVVSKVQLTDEQLEKLCGLDIDDDDFDEDFDEEEE